MNMLTAPNPDLAVTHNEQQQITSSMFRYLTACRLDQHQQPIPNSSLMDVIFESLDVSYPHKWRSAYPTAIDRDLWSKVWAERFAIERIDNDRIKLALNQVGKIQSGFVPTLDEFVRASRPVIDYAAAYAFCLFQWRKRHVLKTKDDWASHNLAYVKDRALFAASVEMQDCMDGQKEYSKVKQQWMLVLDEKLACSDLPAVPPVEIPKPQLSISPQARREAEQPVLGTAKATIPAATDAELALMLHTVRQLYQSLRRAFVDISPNDPLLKKWVANGDAERVHRRAQYVATAPNSRLMRFTWYTPEQMGLVDRQQGATA